MTLVKMNRTGLPQLWNDFFEGEVFRNPSFKPYGTKVPPVNITDFPDYTLVEMAAPGLKRENFKIELNKNQLVVSHEETKENNDKVLLHEFNFQSFRRTFNLPESINRNSISAEYKDGILTISLQKLESEKEVVRLIDVK